MRIFENEQREVRPKVPVLFWLPWVGAPRRCEPRPMRPINLNRGIALRRVPSGRIQPRSNSVDSIWSEKALAMPELALRSLPAPKSDFIGLEGKVHLASGGEPPLLKSHRQAFERFAADKAGGFDGYHRHWQVADQLRCQVARLTGLEAGDIALVGNASDGIVKVLSSIDWQAGDNVVAPALDFASGRFALASLRRQGVDLRLVPAQGWVLKEADLLAACDERTRVIYISQVNALTGQHHHVEVLSETLAKRRTALLLDVSHALGVVPVQGELADFLVSCSYKFLLGIHEGILGWNRRRWPDFEPQGVGWHSATGDDDPGAYRLLDDAQRAEFGNSGHLGAYLLRESLDYLERFGIEAIAGHTSGLAARMIAGMAALGLDVMTPATPGGHAANAAFAHADPERVVRQAAAEHILLWGDNGRVRASAHLFTTEGDVGRFLDRLPVFLKD